MKEKSKKILIVVGVLLVLVVGVSLAYFTSQVLSSGNGVTTTATTATIMDTTFVVEGTLEFNDVDIYPGHKQVSAIKVTATGDNQVVDYNVIWEGINSLYTGLNYTVYKTTTPVDATATCEKKITVQDGAQLYSEECSISNIDSLGESIATGSITRSDETRKIILVENESITSTKTGEVVYYYVVVEYPNLSGVQNQDTNGTFDGIVTVERYTDSSTCGTHNVTTILGVLTVNDCEPDFSYTSEQVDNGTAGTCYFENDAVYNMNDWTTSGSTQETCQKIYKFNNQNSTYEYYDSSLDTYMSSVGNGTWDSESSTCTYEGNTVYDWADIAISSQENCGEVYYCPGDTCMNPYYTMVEEAGAGTWQAEVGGTGIYEAEDDDGTSYYYRGAVENNYVKFAGYYWRIIRINGNGSIRLIYSGEVSTVDAAGATTVLANGYNDLSTKYTQIGTSTFNTSAADNAYVGFMYGTVGATTYAEAHANINSSTIKTYLDNWYANNLSSYASYLDTNAGFCGDRTINTTAGEWSSSDTALGYGKNITYYAEYNRIRNYAPTLKCNNSNDLYTIGSAISGNKALTSPIGLITADEAAYAGGLAYTSNSSFYLYTGNKYWTLSPCYFTGSYARVWYVYHGGSLTVTDDGTINGVSSSYGVRPVINLKTGTQFTGSGTISNPYIVQT